MANYPETYDKEDIITRIEVLEFIQRVWNLIRNKDKWIQDWKCLIKNAVEKKVEELEHARSYYPKRPIMYEGLAL